VRRRTLVVALALASFACGCKAQKPKSAAARPRIVSLSPGITDTLFAIGAGSDLVARSDYCDYPKAVENLPRAGTNLTPSYELISSLSPTLIVGEANAAARSAELQAIAPTRLLPWLTLAEVAESTRELGRLTERSGSADELAGKLEKELEVPTPKGGPRVLLVIGYRPGKLDEIWFIRDNSLHGAALRAAGAQNAVPEAVTGLPRLSPERLIAIDPDAIFVLTLPTQGAVDPLAGFRALEPLRAVEKDTLFVIEAPEAYVHGPRILKLVERLRDAVKAVREKDAK
jgi:iron complex transport system substrate-binding protein